MNSQKPFPQRQRQDFKDLVLNRGRQKVRFGCANGVTADLIDELV